MEELTIQERVQEILVSNGLDFRIDKHQLMASVEQSVVNNLGVLEHKKLVSLPSPYYGLFNSKSGECINSVKKGYTVSQNDEVVELALRGMDNFGDKLSVQKAGSLNGGRKVFIQLALEGLSYVGDDIIKQYITIIDSNDGSTGLSVGIGDLTMSCSNQFYAFYKSGQSRMRHTASLDVKMKEIPTLIDSSLSESMQQIKLYNDFTLKGISDRNIHDMVKVQLGLSKLSSANDFADASSRVTNAMETLYDMIKVEVAQKGNNVWGLHSGVTRWTTHEKSAPTRANGRLESSMVGTNSKSNFKSLEFAKELLTY